MNVSKSNIIEEWEARPSLLHLHIPNNIRFLNIGIYFTHFYLKDPLMAVNIYSSDAKNVAKGVMSPPALAASNAAIYSARLSSGTTTQG